MSLRSQFLRTANEYGDEFWEYQPADFQHEEEAGAVYWDTKRGSVDYVRSKHSLPLAPLDSALESLIKNAWKSAAPSAGAARGGITIGAARPPTVARRNQVYQMTPVTKSASFEQIKDIAKHVATGAARDWSLQKDIPRIRAYAFRGDTRPPLTIKQAGGFSPPITRTDDHYLKNVVYKQFDAYLQAKLGISITYDDFERCVRKSIPLGTLATEFLHYGIWKAIVEHEKWHLGRMLAEEALKGFISTTRATTVAKGFARENGWVYVLYLDGGYLVPDKGAHAWTTIFGEQEIAMPGSIPWPQVKGFRHLDASKKFTGGVYLRDDFDASDGAAAQQCYELLSGRKQ